LAIPLAVEPTSLFSLKKAWKKVKNTVKKITRAAKEFGQRFIKMVEMVICFVGIRPKKYLRLRVHILTDEQGKAAQTEAEVDRWYQEAKRIYLTRANIEVVPATGSSFGSAAIVTEGGGAPDSVMNLGWACTPGDAFSDEADYFEEHLDLGTTQTRLPGWIGNQLGIGEAIHAFVVNTVGTKNGCAFPVIASYCVLQATPKTTTLAHEMAHLCGVGPHSSDATNLMNEDRLDMDSDLGRGQITVIRTSRYVTHFRTEP
jgi:hypothetical protein